MSDVPVTALLHAYRWPDHDALTPILAALEAVSPGRVVRAHERERALGAAALINRAAAGCTDGVLLVAEPCVAWTEAQLRTVVAAAGAGLALARPTAPPLRQAAHSTGARARVPRCRLWGIRTTLFRSLDRLDARLWSVGEIDDLRARASFSGATVTELDLDGRWIGPDSYPLRSDVIALLEIRNELITAFKVDPADALGPRLALASVEALAAAWRAAAIDPKAFRLGGSWKGSRARPASREAGDDPGVWPRDEPRTLLPLLALDSFLREVPSLAAERDALDPDSPLRDAAGAGGGRGETIDDLMGAIGARVRMRGAGPDGGGPDSRTAAAAPDGPPTAAGAAMTAVPPGGPEAPEAVEQAETAPPSVSVIVVNWNGSEHLRACFESLEASDYPADRLELILVDNGSTDGSRDLMAREFPGVRVVSLAENRGFTGGNSAGVAASRGAVLVFFNNDMRVEPRTIARLVAALDDRYACAAARVLSWDGRRIDFIRGTLSFEARGFQEHHGKRSRPELTAVTHTFFPNGGAFAVTRDAYDRCGGFDNHFFASYDDVDLGWRLRMVGCDIRVAAEAVVYHRHGATFRRHQPGQKRLLMDRNALWTAIKNYAEPTLRRALGPILLLATRRIVQETTVRRSTAFARALAPFSPGCRWGFSVGRWSTHTGWRSANLYAAPPGEPTTRTSTASVIRRMPVEALVAVGETLDRSAELSAWRREVQARRVVPDDQILPTFGRALERNSSGSSYTELQEALVDALDLRRIFRGRPRVLIVTHEPLRANMAGPGVRALEIGRALSRRFAVTVATPYPPGDRRRAVRPGHVSPRRSRGDPVTRRTVRRHRGLGLHPVAFSDPDAARPPGRRGPVLPLHAGAPGADARAGRPDSQRDGGGLGRSDQRPRDSEPRPARRRFLRVRLRAPA